MSKTSAPSSKIGLTHVGVGSRFDDLGPILNSLKLLRPISPSLSVPADLFHLKVKLHGVASWIEYIGAIVNPGAQLTGKLYKTAAILLQKGNSIFELPVVATCMPKLITVVAGDSASSSRKAIG